MTKPHINVPGILFLVTLFLTIPLTASLPGGQARGKATKPPIVTTRSATTLGIDAMTVNGSIQPHGLPTSYYFEYGPTAAYGLKTPTRPLPPKLAAFYRETWDDGPGGFYSWTPTGKEYHAKGGVAGGFFSHAEPTRHDHNHDNGIGTVHLSKYLYTGPWGKLTGHASANLAAGDPDLRDAKVSIYVRGRDWFPNGSELMWWTQSQSNIEVLNRGYRHANWAYSGFSLADRLASGKWEKVEYRLKNDTEDWTYAGGTGRYTYWNIDDSQAHVNCDFFHMVTYVDVANPPKGAIDFDEFELAYRNYSLVLPSNGGKLIRAPAAADDPATLTDGWRNGLGKTWRSAANPKGPLEFVYSFLDPVTIRSVQLHQNPDWPAKDVEVLTSHDGKNFAPLLKKVLPEKGNPNANFAYTLDEGLSVKAGFLMVRLAGGYRKEHWGLGEIEVFGNGATMLTDDDLYHVNTDLKGLKPGATYHYRLVATNSGGKVSGPDRMFTVPADRKPHVVTRAAARIKSSSAKVQGRLNPLGVTSKFYFEYGPDKNYGSKTKLTYGGDQFTPRLAFATLTGLKPSTTYHYRLAAVNEKGTSTGEDAVFVTLAKRD